MGIFSVTLKTHSRENITKQCNSLNPCITHGVKPEIFRTVAGKRKEVFFTAHCEHDECGKIATSKTDIEKYWNEWNPL